MKTRRQFIYDGSKLALVGMLSPSINGFAKPGDADVELRIVQIIKALSLPSNTQLTILYPKGCIDNLTPIINRFEKITGISIKPVEGSLDEISAELIATHLLDKKSQIDIALPSTFSLPDLAENGVIQSLESYVSKYALNEKDRSHLYLKGDSYEGSTYGHQTDGDAFVMFYNKKLLESKREQDKYAAQYNSKLEIPKTWEELDQLVRFFHRPKENLYGGCLFRNQQYTIWEFWARMHGKGLYPVDDNMRPNFEKKEAVKALQELIATTKYLDPQSSKNSLFENFASFAEGNKFCNIGWGGTQKFLNQSSPTLKNNLLFSSLPGGTFEGKSFDLPYFNWGWNFVITSWSKNKDLAYLFNVFATSPKVSNLAIQEAGGYFDPYRIEHYEDSKIEKIYTKEFLKTHRDSMKRSIPDFYLHGQGQYFSILRKGISAALKGDLEAEIVLREVTKKWNEITDNLGREKQVKQWRSIKNKYPSNLKRILT